MKYYRKPDGTILCFKLDGSQDHLIEAGYVLLSNTEVAAYLPSLSVRQAERWELIKKYRDNLQLNGGVKVGTNWFLTTERAVGEYTVLAVKSQRSNLPDATILRAGWRTMNGALVDMTPGLIAQILDAGFAQIAAIDTVSQSHKTAMEQSATPETYDYSAGWPVVFTG
jgi:hypothetical protein